MNSTLHKKQQEEEKSRQKFKEIDKTFQRSQKAMDENEFNKKEILDVVDLIC
jgi:hypothetical protein